MDVVRVFMRWRSKEIVVSAAVHDSDLGFEAESIFPGLTFSWKQTIMTRLPAAKCGLEKLVVQEGN